MSTFQRGLSSFFGTIFIGFGINAILRPEHALTFFELDYRSSVITNTQVVDVLLAIYGVRDIFMGLVIYLLAYYGRPKGLGCVMMLCSGVGVADGVICKTMVGGGEWNHFGYAPILAVLGAMMVFGIAT